MMLAACRTVVGAHETYAVEHVGHRPTGDLDVVVSATPHDHNARPVYLPFRRSQGTWRPLAGRAHELDAAIRLAGSLTRYAGWDCLDLAAVLATVEGA